MVNQNYPPPSSPPANSIGASPAYNIFIYAAPVILAFSISICCVRLLLTYFMRAQRRRHHTSPRALDYDTEQPSSLSIAFSRSPFFEIFRQAPPPPSYDDSVKHLERQQQIQNENNNNNNASYDTVPIEAPPIDSNAPPGYSHENRANPV